MSYEFTFGELTLSVKMGRKVLPVSAAYGNPLEKVLEILNT